MNSAKRFILTYEAKVRTGPRSFFTRSYHSTKPLTLSQARKFYNKLQKCRQVFAKSVAVKYAEGVGF